MECPYCESQRIIVTKTKNGKDVVKRFRKCQSCHKNFTTTEVIDRKIKTMFGL